MILLFDRLRERRFFIGRSLKLWKEPKLFESSLDNQSKFKYLSRDGLCILPRFKNSSDGRFDRLWISPMQLPPRSKVDRLALDVIKMSEVEINTVSLKNERDPQV